MRSEQTYPLPDGRGLAYAEYGDPDGQPGHLFLFDRWGEILGDLLSIATVTQPDSHLERQG